MNVMRCFFLCSPNWGMFTEKYLYKMGFTASGHLFLGTSPSGFGDLQENWADFLPLLKHTYLTSRMVSLFGLGDSDSYPDTCVDGMGELYAFFFGKGCKITETVPLSGYCFEICYQAFTVTTGMIQIISRISSGLVFKCPLCNKIHIEFKNLNFNFSEKEYKHFTAYINNLDGFFGEMQNASSVFTRKIRIPLNDTNSFCFLLNTEELGQFKELLSVRPVSATERLLQDVILPLRLN